METLREFKGKCRGVSYKYRLIRVNGELILETFNDTSLVDSLTWGDTKTNLSLVLKACDTIEGR